MRRTLWFCVGLMLAFAVVPAFAAVGLVCEGDVTNSAAAPFLAQCSSPWVIVDVATWTNVPVAVDLALLGVTVESTTSAFLWGFGGVMSIWALGYITGIAIRAIGLV